MSIIAFPTSDHPHWCEQDNCNSDPVAPNDYVHTATIDTFTPRSGKTVELQLTQCSHNGKSAPVQLAVFDIDTELDLDEIDALIGKLQAAREQLAQVH